MKLPTAILAAIAVTAIITLSGCGGSAPQPVTNSHEINQAQQVETREQPPAAPEWGE